MKIHSFALVNQMLSPLPGKKFPIPRPPQTHPLHNRTRENTYLLFPSICYFGIAGSIGLTVPASISTASLLPPAGSPFLNRLCSNSADRVTLPIDPALRNHPRPFRVRRPVKRSANGFKIWGATKGYNSPKRPAHSRYSSPTLREAVPFSSNQ